MDFFSSELHGMIEMKTSTFLGLARQWIVGAVSRSAEESRYGRTSFLPEKNWPDDSRKDFPVKLWKKEMLAP
jgi:hypothetical protein